MQGPVMSIPHLYPALWWRLSSGCGEIEAAGECPTKSARRIAQLVFTAFERQGVLVARQDLACSCRQNYCLAKTATPVMVLLGISIE